MSEGDDKQNQRPDYAGIAAVHRPNDEAFSELISLVNQQEALTLSIENAKASLKEREAELKAIATAKIPQLMKDCNISNLSLTSGKSISIKRNYFAKIPKDKTREAMAWLDVNGYSGAVKRIIAANTPQDENKAKELKEFLFDNEIDFDINENINAQTLKKIVRETMEEGKEIPLEAFGVYVENISIIK
jgi:hypothetical protein